MRWTYHVPLDLPWRSRVDLERRFGIKVDDLVVIEPTCEVAPIRVHRELEPTELPAIEDVLPHFRLLGTEGSPRLELVQ